MAASIDAIMEAFGTRLNSIPGLRGFGYANDNPQLDKAAAFPLVPGISSYRDAMKRGNYVVVYQIALLTGAVLDRVGQHRLARYASPTGELSVRAALEDGDRTLGGLINDLVVDSFDPGGLEPVGLGNYYGGVFSVRVIASGV